MTALFHIVIKNYFTLFEVKKKKKSVESFMQSELEIPLWVCSTILASLYSQITEALLLVNKGFDAQTDLSHSTEQENKYPFRKRLHEFWCLRIINNPFYITWKKNLNEILFWKNFFIAISWTKSINNNCWPNDWDALSKLTILYALISFILMIIIN